MNYIRQPDWKPEASGKRRVDMTAVEREKRMDELKKELRELRSLIPSHGAPVAMQYRQMEIEDEIADLRAQGDRK